MVLNIERDHGRFKSIVRGKIKENLRKFMSRGEMLGKKGKDIVSIPLPTIELPRFKFGDKKMGGVGQGDGDPGTPLGGDGESGAGEAGDAPGEHALEVEMTIDELARILGEELELPSIKPKGSRNVKAKEARYASISRTGPESLRHFRRTFRRALRRQLASGLYDPKNPIIIPLREDVRYRAPRDTFKPRSTAVIIHMMDVSGSMGDEQKEIVRTEAFWIDTWLRSQYHGLETRYIIHDAVAREVDEDTFYRTKESGGTVISSAYKLCLEILQKEYPSNEWNIYPFHFSDGDNWSESDTDECLRLLNERLLPQVNLFCYGQVESQYGSGQFLQKLEKGIESKENVALSKIGSRDEIYTSIKEFLGKGR